MTLMPRSPRHKALRSAFAMGATALLLALMLVMPAPTAQAASLNVDVDIVWPSILILYCYSDVDVTVTSAVLGSLFTGTASGDQGVPVAGPGAAVATLSGTDLVADVNLGSPDTDLLVDPAAVNLILDNVCAIRAVSTAGGSGVQVDVALTANTQLLNGTATIDLSNPQVRVDAGAFGAPVTFTPGGLGTLHNVDVQLSLDVSGADEAGTYSSAVDDNVTVTATLI